MTTAPVSDIDIFSDEVLADPYPFLDQLRSLGSVVYLPSHDVYMLTRYEAVREALTNWQVFVSGQGVMFNDPMNGMFAGGKNLLCSDGDHHTRLRRVIHAPLSPRALEDVKAHIVSEANAIVERVVAQGTFDAAGEFAHHLPTTIVSTLVGVPEEGREQMVEWGTASFNAIGPMNARAGAAFEVLAGSMGEFIGTQCVPGKLSPDGWAQGLWNAVDSGALEPHEPMMLMFDYMGPSLDTTINATASLMWLLASNPDQWELLKANPELALGAVNEALRVETTIQTFARVTSVDHVVDGVVIPAGSRVAVHWGSANRDERMFAEPNAFKIDRKNADQHLTFGFGRHSCPGGHLAKMEMTSILEALLARVDKLELVEASHGFNNTLRVMDRCVVRAEPVSVAAHAAR